MLGQGSVASLGAEITKAPVFFPVLEGSSGKIFLPYSCLDLFNLEHSLLLISLLGSVIPLQQLRPRQNKSQEEGVSSGCLATATSCSAAQKHWVWLGTQRPGNLLGWGNKHSLGARPKHTLIFSKNDLTTFFSTSHLPAQSWSLCGPSKRTRSRFPRMLAPQPEADYQLVRDLPHVLWTTSRGIWVPSKWTKRQHPRSLCAWGIEFP